MRDWLFGVGSGSDRRLLPGLSEPVHFLVIGLIDCSGDWSALASGFVTERERGKKGRHHRPRPRSSNGALWTSPRLDIWFN